MSTSYLMDAQESETVRCLISPSEAVARGDGYNIPTRYGNALFGVLGRIVRRGRYVHIEYIAYMRDIDMRDRPPGFLVRALRRRRVVSF